MLNELLAEPEFKSMQPIVVNYDTDTEFKKAFNVPNRSTVIVFKNGREVSRASWITDKDELRQVLMVKP